MPPQIVAMGGGGFTDAGRLTPLDRYLLDLTGRERPRVCFLGTASGDAEGYTARFYRAYASASDASDLALFGSPTPDDVARLPEQDLVFVGGGSTANLLVLWRLHGVDRVLRSAWEAGTILAGMSAGANCWFEASLSDSFGPQLAPLADGVGFLPGSRCPHFDGEPLRHGRYAEEIAAGRLPGGFGIDDGAALHFVGGELHAVVAEEPGKRAYRLDLEGDRVEEIELDATFVTEGTDG
jgi:dipeptidase E